MILQTQLFNNATFTFFFFFLQLSHNDMSVSMKIHWCLYCILLESWSLGSLFLREPWYIKLGPCMISFIQSYFRLIS